MRSTPWLALLQHCFRISCRRCRNLVAYCGNEIPVAEATSSTRPPILLVASIAALRPLLNTPAEHQVVNRRPGS